MGFLVLAASGATSEPFTAHAWGGPTCAFDAAMTLPDRFDREVAPEPAPMCPPVGELFIDPAPLLEPDELTHHDAREAWIRARELRGSERYEEALLALGVVEQVMPVIADRIAFERGRVLVDAGRPGEAIAAFEEAKQSPDSTLRGHARVARVRAMIAADHRDAGRELTALLRYYPQLPNALELRFDLARAREQGRDVQAAIRTYREIDMTYPGTPLAARARERLDALARSGVPVRPLSRAQLVDRAERLTSQGPMDRARAEVERLLGEQLTMAQRARMAAAAVRIARIEGRWEDARRYLREGGRAPLPSDPERRDIEEQRRAATSAAAVAREQDAALASIAALVGRTRWEHVPQVRLLGIVKIAARAGLQEELDRALLALRRNGNLQPVVALEAGLYGAGLGDDASIAALFASIVSNPRYGTQARYHYARALERMGRHVEAEIQFLRVIQIDRSETRWYALLSEQRLWGVHEAMLARCGPAGSDGEGEEEGAAKPADGAGPALASLSALPSRERREPPREGMRSPTDTPVIVPPEPNVPEMIERLEPLVEAHGDAFPFFERARVLLELGELDAAADELHEAYLGWREARGRPLNRTGLEAVYRGEQRPRVPVPFSVRAQRRRLDRESIDVLVDITSALGDEGTAVGLAGWARVRARPRAYEAIVQRAARRHGLDPNLLLAVMRVESVYEKRIVSYAGAVGLMQIMPRTGRLIANELGRSDFTTADLLDPETNLDFAAWYLASLIERFDGRLPLAIASYNGGPHNVRLWLRAHGDRVPIDAFVEHIPFDQTHRYVRRVLSHYAAYRAQQGLPMERLHLEQPQIEPDTVSF
jgi:soluble lytic murein transglycosylase